MPETGNGARSHYATQVGELVTSRSVQPQQYGCVLSAIFDEWVRRDVGKVYGIALE